MIASSSAYEIWVAIAHELGRSPHAPRGIGWHHTESN
jgi:hypothetical protein